MKARLISLFSAALLLLAAVSAWGQSGKIYTRKVRLEDFPTRTTKVVLAGNSFLELALREEVAVHWRIAPYEFCSQQEYEQLRTSNHYYFLTLSHEGGIAYLMLSKGGRDGEKESLNKPFEVIRMPIANYEEPSGRELVLMGAFLDIIQTFVEEAMISDRTAYSGLSAVNGGLLRGKTVYLDPDAADEAFLRQEPGALVAVSIAPTAPAAGSDCFKMLISADTHELFLYDKSRYKSPRDAMFTEADIKRFERRGATVIQDSPGGVGK